MKISSQATRNLSRTTEDFPARVLITKLVPARTRPDSVYRRHLVDLLQADPGQQVVLIEAPAGYGKSTLAAQWLNAESIPVVWVSLDEFDNDPIRFFGAIVAALQGIDPEVGLGAYAQLEDPMIPSERAIIEALLNDLSAINRPCALVLDDYHVIRDPGLHQSVSVLLRNLPASMRVVILARSFPRLPLARLRASGQLLEIGADDLRFTDAEAVELLTGQGSVPLLPQEVAVLNRNTEGWPVGLRLAWHLMKGQPRERSRQLVEEFSGDIGPVESFVWEEVLQDFPDALVRFATRSAIFERFSARLCDEVFDTDDSALMIQELDASSLFLIPLDLHGTWFRYHHLFRDVLRKRFERSTPEGEATGYHRSAAEWLEINGHPDEAIAHAVAGGDWPRAIALTRPLAQRLYAMDIVASLRARLDVLPDSVLTAEPDLIFYKAWALSRSGQIATGVEALRMAERAWVDTNDRHARGRLALLNAFHGVVASDFQGAIDHSVQAIELLPNEIPLEPAMASLFMANSLVTLGLPLEAERVLDSRRMGRDATESAARRLDSIIWGSVLVAKGQLTEAEQLFRQAIRSEEPTTFLQIPHALDHLGKLYVEQLRLDEAEQCFKRGLELSEETGARLWAGRLIYGMSMVSRARGEYELAVQYAESATSISEQLQSPQETRKGQALLARLWLDAGHLALVRGWFSRLDQNPFEPRKTFEYHFESALYARLLDAEGEDVRTAMTLLDLLRAECIMSGRVADAIEVDILRAVALRSAGETASSVFALESAIALSGSNRFIRIFVDEGQRIVPILRHIASRGTHKDAALRLLSAIGNAASHGTVDQPGMPEPLSDREIQVLSLVAAGYPNKVIGDRLFISEKTVKKHVSNILGKLGASNRTQAVDQGRRLGLLDSGTETN